MCLERYIYVLLYKLKINLVLCAKYLLTENYKICMRVLGTSHADDVSYFLNVTFIPQDARRTGVEADLQSQMLDLWGTFAKSG